MRYGILRKAPDLLDATTQRLWLERAGCDAVLEDDGPSRSFAARVEQLVERLKPGDEILVEDLRVLPLSSLPRLLLLIMRAGASLRIGSGPDTECVRPSHDGIKLLTLLAPHGLPPAADKPFRLRPRRRGASLTRYQVQHARKLFRQGMSVREIGMVFRLAPEEVATFLSPQSRSQD